jgi:DNA-binding XRE family transcriptional regulator
LCAGCYADLDLRACYAPKPGGRASSAARPELEPPPPGPQHYFTSQEYADPEARKRGYAERFSKSVQLFGRQDGLVPSDAERHADFCRYLQNLALPARLQHLLVRHGMDAAQLAEWAGVGQRTIYAYLEGQFRPSYRAAQKLARALGVPAEVILHDEPIAALAAVR